MKRIIAFVCLFTILFSINSCSFILGDTNGAYKEYTEVDSDALLEYLRDNIEAESTVDEVIDVFSQMCDTHIEDDLLLFEYGTFDFTGEDLFYFELVRQYPDGDGEYYQITVSLTFLPDEENAKLSGAHWSDLISGNFFDYIRGTDAYNYAKANSARSIDIFINYTA